MSSGSTRTVVKGTVRAAGRARRRVGRLLCGSLLAAAFGCENASAPSPDTLEFVPAGESRLVLGTTHTQYSLDPWSDPTAVARAAAWLSAHPLLQNQHLMGWGALNPRPTPERYDWNSLDRRVDLVLRTGGTPVLTLCCAPDWMKGGAPGETDWSRLAAAPRPEHYADFAELARQAALRYPAVRHFQVWNELKGFFRADLNRWDYEGYTVLYNLVYDAIRSVRPDALIGGPYVVLDSWSEASRMSHPSTVAGPWGVLDQRPLDVIEYWLRHGRGAHFITVDLGTATRDAGLTTDPFAATEKYRAVTEWLRARTSLPVWLAEWYVTGATADHEEQAALMMTALLTAASAGAAVALQWGPQAEGSACLGGCLWTDVATGDGGKPTALAEGFAAFGAAFPPGTPIYHVRGLPPGVAALASATYILFVNQRREERQLELGGAAVRLRPLEVRLVARD